MPDFFPATWTSKRLAWSKQPVKEINGKKATILGPLYDFTGDERVLKSPFSLAQFSCTASEYKLTALHMRLS